MSEHVAPDPELDPAAVDPAAVDPALGERLAGVEAMPIGQRAAAYARILEEFQGSLAAADAES